MRVLFLMLANGASVDVVADEQNNGLDPREYRLLKSWGLQPTASGSLRFQADHDNDQPPAAAWQPDLSPYRIRPSIQRGEALNPVVISARQKQ
jgi:hypothetical protein